MLCVTGVKLDCHVPILCSVVKYFRPDSTLESVSAEESASPGSQGRSLHLLSWAPGPCGAQHEGPVCSPHSVLMGRITISIQCCNENV